MEEEKKVEKNTSWGVAIGMFGSISTWVIAPIVLALIIGKMLDKYYRTEPWIFLGATLIAFIISIGGISKILVKYLKDLEKEKREKSNGETS